MCVFYLTKNITNKTLTGLPVLHHYALSFVSQRGKLHKRKDLVFLVVFGVGERRAGRGREIGGEDSGEEKHNLIV